MGSCRSAATEAPGVTGAAVRSGSWLVDVEWHGFGGDQRKRCRFRGCDDV
jgi:hypothetical protein